MARLSRRISASTLVILAGVATAAASPSGPRLDETEAIARSEAAIGRVVRDQTLLAPDGTAVRLSGFRGRPLVLSLVYTSCSSVCPTTTQSVRSAVARARQALGADSFQVLTLGFDARNDSPNRMAAFAADQDIDADPLWHLASGDGAAVAALLEDVGFSYSASAGGFEHVTQTTILDSDGRVHRQVYGDTFPLQVFVEPLKGLVFGTATRAFSPAALADRIRFLCTVYDPATGRYRIDYGLAIGMPLGALSLLLTGLLIFRMWRNNQRLLQERQAGH